MKITILTIVAAIYMGNDPIASKWTTFTVDSMDQCRIIAETMESKTIVDNRPDWDGYIFITTAFCGIETFMEDENEND